jgi:hypothetical protein
MNQITIALDSASDFLTKVGSTVERVFNGLHGKVCMPSVYDLKDKVIPSLSGYL